MFGVILGQVGPITDHERGTDLPEWARMDAWSVTRWALVLDACADRLAVYGTRQVRVPAIGLVYIDQLAALVHRTTEPPPVRGLVGWLRMVFHLEPIHVRQQRLAWRMRTRVAGLIRATLHRRWALHQDERPDMFAPHPGVVPVLPPNKPRA